MQIYLWSVNKLQANSYQMLHKFVLPHSNIMSSISIMWFNMCFYCFRHCHDIIYICTKNQAQAHNQFASAGKKYNEAWTIMNKIESSAQTSDWWINHWQWS